MNNVCGRHLLRNMGCVGVFPSVGVRKKERERNVAMINYRYDGIETPPLHPGYYVLYVLRDIKDRILTASMCEVKPIHV